MVGKLNLDAIWSDARDFAGRKLEFLTGARQDLPVDCPFTIDQVRNPEIAIEDLMALLVTTDDVEPSRPTTPHKADAKG